MPVFLYPNLPKYFDINQVNAETIYHDLLSYTSELKFLLEQRDTQVAASPSTKIYKVLDIGTIKNPQTGDVAYEASSEGYYGYTSAAGWQRFNGGLGARGYYGSYYSDDTVCITSLGQSHSVSLTNTNDSYGVTITNGSQVKVQYNGVYNIQVSYQFFNSLAQIGNGITWFKKNGTNISYSASYAAVPAKHAGGDGALILAYNIVVSLSANDYVETFWTAETSGIYVQDVSTSGGIPDSPAVIFTIQQV